MGPKSALKPKKENPHKIEPPQQVNYWIKTALIFIDFDWCVYVCEPLS